MQSPSTDLTTSDQDVLRQQLLENLPSGVVAYKLEEPGAIGDLRVVHINDAAARLLAVDQPAQFVGMLIKDVAPQAQEDPNYVVLQRVAKTGQAEDLGDVEVSDERIGRRVFSSRAFPLPDRGVGVVFEDVTSRREIERTYERQSVRFRAIFDTTFQFIGLLKTDGTLLEANQTALDFGGITEKDVIGKPFWDCYWWSHDQTVQEQLKAAIQRAADGEFVRYNVQIRGANDVPAVIDFSLKPVVEDGKVVMLLPEGRVITELVRTQRALKRLQARTERILNAAGEGIIGVGPDGLVLFVNEAAASLLGPAARNLRGRHYGEVLQDAAPAETGSDVEGGIRRVLSGEKSARSGRTAFALTEGGPLPVEFIVTAVKEDGRTGAVVVFRDISERIEAERALRESEKRHRSVVEALHEGVVLQDAEGNIIAANPAAERILGLTLDQLMERDSVDARWRVVDEDNKTLPGENHPAMVALRTGQPVENFVQGVHTPEGDLRWLLVSSSPIKGADGHPEAVVSAFTDITQQRESENRIRDSELRYRTVLSTLNEGVMLLSKDGVVLAHNPAAQQILGLDLDDGNNLFAFTNRTVIDEEGQPIPPERIPERVAVETGEPQRGFVKGIVQSDGSVRWVSVNAQPIPRSGVDQNSGAVVVSFVDITEQLEATRALTESEARLRNAQHIAKLGHWRWDPQSDTITWSDQMYDIYGQDRQTFQPDFQHFLSVIDPGTRERTRETIMNAMGDKKPYEVFHEIQRLDGTRRFVHGRGEPVVDSDGQLLSLQGTCQDITDLHEAQEALRRYARELEERNSELEQFAYVASHDLQEPLRMVSSFLQLLERRYGEQLDDTAEEYIRYAVDGAKRMQRLIQDLLAYSRVGTRGKAFQRVEMDEIVKEVQLDLRSAIDETGARVDVKTELPIVQADPTQMRQLMQNIIGNAIKFRGEAPPQIEISVEKLLDAGRLWYQFDVRDNGIGIAPEHAERIFQIFQRLHTREEFEGTGIGLAICRKIVERHDGRIWMEPNPNGGSIFRFTLPVRRQHHIDPSLGPE